MRRLLQKLLAAALLVLGVVVVGLAVFPVQFPDWWPNLGIALPSLEMLPVTWWPAINGIKAVPHYSARILLTVAFGLIIFLPQVELTFVSLMRRQSPIGARYVDRKTFTCPACGTVNRPEVQFCVKCGSQVYAGTRHWGMRPGQGQGEHSGLKSILTVCGLLAFFLGAFDPTIYSALTAFLGTGGGTVLLATVLSAIPSIAAYAALKEGPLRRYGSLKGFDRLVFGDAIWIAFGLLFIVLAAYTLLGPLPSIVGSLAVLFVEAIMGFVLILYPVTRRRLARSVTLAYT